MGIKRSWKDVKSGFRRVSLEIESNFRLLVVLNAIVRTIIVFLISFLLISTVGVYWWVALVPAGLYFIIFHHIKIAENPYRTVEEKYPELKDMLTTAHDNPDENNEIVMGLHEDVKKKIRDAKISDLIDIHRLKRDITYAAVLGLIIVLIAPFNPILLNLGFDISEIAKETRILFGGGSGSGGDGVGVGAEDDIFGDKSIALLGDKDLDIKFAYGDDTIDITKINKPKKLEFTSSYPEEVGAVSSESFEENIPKEQQELVKNYYKKIAEE